MTAAPCDPDVVIIGGVGANIASLQFAFKRLGARARVSTDPSAIANSPRVVLPGVGCAADAMARLRELGLADLLPRLRRPLLGICLGMQLLFEHSEEGDTDCLGILPGAITRIRPGPNRSVPHMGWNQLTGVRADPLLEGIQDEEYLYFVHSYAACPSELTLAVTPYGNPLSAVVRTGNFWGTQFHPERSAAAGARILANFLRLN